MKLTKHEKDRITAEFAHVRRDATWVGIRPTTFKSRKYDKKARRAESCKICSEWC